jgi:hypothetical protein
MAFTPPQGGGPDWNPAAASRATHSMGNLGEGAAPTPGDSTLQAGSPPLQHATSLQAFNSEKDPFPPSSAMSITSRASKSRSAMQSFKNLFSR